MHFEEVEELDGLEFSFTDTIKSAFSSSKSSLPVDPLLAYKPQSSSGAMMTTTASDPVTFSRDLPWYEKKSNLPLIGEVKRKFLLGGVGALGLLGFLYYRSTQGGARRTAMAGYNRKRRRKSKSGKRRGSKRRRGRR